MRALLVLLKVVMLLLVLVLGVLAGADNSTPVGLTLLGWDSPRLSLFAWLAMALLVGFLLGLGSASLANLRLRLREGKVRRELVSTREEVQGLRNLAPGD